MAAPAYWFTTHFTDASQPARVASLLN